MEYQSITYEKVDTVGIVTLNRPGRNNALSIALLGEMNCLLAGIAASREVKVLVVRAAGKNFCAGHDLTDLAGKESINGRPEKALVYENRDLISNSFVRVSI